MRSTPDAAGALAAVEETVERGGEADEVLRAVLAALHERGIPYAEIRFVEADELVPGPSVGAETEALRVPVRYEERRVGEVAVATEDVVFAERLAALIAPYVLVGWDTSGEPWAP